MFLSPKYADKHMDVIQNDWKGLVTIALMNGFQIACNNASLTVMELSMNQARTPPQLAASTLHPATTQPARHTLRQAAARTLHPATTTQPASPRRRSHCDATSRACIARNQLRPHVPG